MKVKFVNEAALAPMLRDVIWREDKAPHRRGTFRAQVLHGESQSNNAGPTLAGIVANPWTVRVPTATPENALAKFVKVGDELKVEPGIVLAVQQISRSLAGHLVVRCTESARAPL